MKKVQGPAVLRQALYDGCLTANWSRGSNFYHAFARYRQDSKLMDDPVYVFAWKRAYIYCYLNANPDSHQKFLQRLGKNPIGGMFDPRQAKTLEKIPGGDFPVDFYIQDTTLKHMPGYHENNSNGFFGLWGTCQFC